MKTPFRNAPDDRIPKAPPSEPPRSNPRPPSLAKLQQGLALEGIIVEHWQMDYLELVLSAARRRPFDIYSIGRSKSHHRIQSFAWAATKHPHPPGVDDDPSMRLHLNMWPPDQLPKADPRQQALAAKAARGKGPPSSASWRGKERSTKYRTQ